MQFASRFVLAVVPALVIWGGFKAYEHDQAETVRTRLLPRIEQALAADVEEFSDAAVCVPAPRFPYAQGLPVTGWVKLPNGLSECRVIGRMVNLPPCKGCSTLEDMGLLEKAQVAMQDETGQAVTLEVVRLTDRGRALYYADTGSRRAWKDETCTLGQTTFVSADRAHESQSGSPGFCFADGIKLNGIPEFQNPQKNGAQAMMGIKYDVEVVNPDPLMFSQDMKMLLDKTPRRGNPALLPRETTTAVFPIDQSERPYFDSGLLYGDWAVEKMREETH